MSTSQLKSLRVILKRINTVKNLISDIKLVGLYLLSFPDWVHWKRPWRDKLFNRPRKTNRHYDLDSLHIIFVTRRARARELKLAYTAKLGGHRVSLVAKKIETEALIRKSFLSYNAAVNPWQILALLDELRPDVVHVMADNDTGYFLPIVLFAPAPVVYDPYDCTRGMLKIKYRLSWIKLKTEEICFSKADHICSRSLEPSYIRRHFGYSLPNTTYFPEYCWRVPKKRNYRLISDNDNLHVVYCGGVYPEDRYPSSEYGYAQYLEIGRELAKQQIHLHIYPDEKFPGIKFEKFFKLYLEESQINPFFHINHPLPYGELISKLSLYDAALHIYGVQNNQLGRSTNAKINCSSANKLFDYIEAGLPVIINKGRHQSWIVRHYGTAIQVDAIENIRPYIIKALRNKGQSLHSCTLKYHASRLSRMYKSVVQRLNKIK